MSDTARSALKKLKAHFAKGENLRLKRTAAQKHLRTILSEIHDLRERLEEVREERDDWKSQAKALDLRHDGLRERLSEVEEDAARYANSNLQFNESYNRLRRQCDRLREAVREAKGALKWQKRRLPPNDHGHGDLQDYIDRLANALDGSEGEDWKKRQCGACGAASGEPCWDNCPAKGCDCPIHGADADEVGEVDVDCLMGTPADTDGCYRLLGSGELKTLSDCPVHADEPERDVPFWFDEWRAVEGVPEEIIDALTLVSEWGPGTDRHDAGVRRILDWHQSQPTDEPVSGEGEEAGPPWNRENTGPPPRHTCVKWLRDGECWICGRNEFFAKAAAEKATHADARSGADGEWPYEYLSDDAVGQGIQHQYNEGDAIGSVTQLALEAARRLRKDEGGEKGE